MNFSFDIDGTLTDYPRHWLAFIEINLGMKFESVSEAKEKLGVNVYSQIKHEYRLSEEKFKEPIRENLIDLSQKIYERKNLIYIHSSRPFSKYPNMMSKTAKWLQKSGFRFEKIDSKNIHNFIKYEIDYHIENEIEHCFPLLELDYLKGILLIESPDMGSIAEKRITPVKLESLSNHILDEILIGI
jgi:hypothetical protein